MATARRPRQNQTRDDKRRRAQAAVAAARRSRNHQLWIAGGALAVVIAIVVVFVAVKLAGDSASASSGSTASSAQVKSVTDLVTSVPAKALDAVGAGTGVTPPVTLKGQSPLTAGGLPRVVYIGAEYCPYCAAERWGLVTALSRFGTFTGLGLTTSSSTDTDPNTPTLTFLNAKYTSTVLSFTSYEIQDRSGKALQTPSSADEALLTKFDSPQYVPHLTDASAGSIPFVDIGNRYLVVGSQYQPQLLAGLTHLQIAKDLSSPSSPVAQAIDGEANILTAALCKTTGGKPGSVCTAAGVTAAAASLTS